MTTDCVASLEDTTQPVLASLQRDAEALMADLTRCGDARAASCEASPHELALLLRLGSRLARVGGWVLAHRQGDAREQAAAGDALLSADRREELDDAADIGPLASLADRIDRLVARALRLNALLSQDR